MAAQTSTPITNAGVTRRILIRATDAALASLGRIARSRQHRGSSLRVLAALWLSISLVGASCGGANNNAIAPPATGVYFGAKTGYYQSDLSAFESLIRRKVAIRAISVPWDGIWPDTRLVQDHDQGRLDLITWRGTDLGQILSGQFDDMIRARAREVRQLGFPIFVRPMHEMNGDWFPWCCHPDEYQQSWRRIHDIFSEEGAINVAWVWSPATSRGGWESYYPGDDYVDWVGASLYNWGLSRPDTRWQRFTEILEPFYEYVVDKRKPLMLAEVGSAEQGGDKAAWLRAAAAALEERFPAVKAWIHQQYEDGDADWRVDSSQATLEAYRGLVSSPYFGARPAERADSVTGSESSSNE
jgi:Glycosyl hydrolase family 26